MHTHQIIKISLFALGGFLLLAIIVATGLYYSRGITQPDEAVCTQEAKRCSDGSYVGRTGPNCEFSACPDENAPDTSLIDTDTSAWKTYRNEEYGFEFRYPEEWAAIEGKNKLFVELGQPELIQSGGVIVVFIRDEVETQYIKNIVEQGKSHGKEIIHQSNVLLGGNSATHLYLNNESAGNNQEIIIAVKNNLLYEVSVSPNTQYNKKVFDNLVSTFKFIK